MKKSSFLILISILLYACNVDTNSSSTVQLASGYELYQKNCANCHGDDGSGLKRLIPPLKNADFILANPQTLKEIIVKGMQGSILVNGIQYNSLMPANPKITDTEAEAIKQFVLIKFNKAAH
jgi:mono/diheme cytochrome c family protein